MVQEMLVSDNNSPMSPARISFSYDLVPQQSDVVQPQTPLSPCSVDFDFLVRKSCCQDSPTADELFSGGKILPAEIKKTHKPKSPENPTLPEIPAIPDEKQSSGETEENKEKQNGRSFWGFKRSSSLNCSGSYGPGLCPLPLLSRSHSTGSAGGSKRAQKPGPGSFQKPPLKKSYGVGGGQVNGLRVNPVINIFGMGSIFSGSHGRDKSKIVKK